MCNLVPGKLLFRPVPPTYRHGINPAVCGRAHISRGVPDHYGVFFLHSRLGQHLPHYFGIRLQRVPRPVPQDGNKLNIREKPSSRPLPAAQ